MKKTFILSLVLTLLLAGCGSTTAEEPKTETKQEAVVEDTAPAPTETVPEVVEEEPEVEEPEVEELPEEEGGNHRERLLGSRRRKGHERPPGRMQGHRFRGKHREDPFFRFGRKPCHD